MFGEPCPVVMGPSRKLMKGEVSQKAIGRPVGAIDREFEGPSCLMAVKGGTQFFFDPHVQKLR